MIYFRETSINTSELNPDCVLIDTEDADTDTDVNLICNKRSRHRLYKLELIDKYCNLEKK